MSGISNWPWQHWARHRPDKTALLAEGEAIAWARLANQVERLAVGFRQKGVYPGSGVMLRAGTSLSAVMAYLSLLRCGARLLPVNPQLPHEQLRALLPSLNVEFLLNLEEKPSGWQEEAYGGNLSHAISLLSLTESDESPQPGRKAASVAILSLTELDESPQPAWNLDSVATLTLTSGSVGLPKAVAHTFRAHLASAAGVTERLGFTADDSWLLSLPLFHVSGQGILWRWLHVGATLATIGDRPLHKALDECTFASLVPTQLWRLLQQPAFPSRLRSVLLGGAAIPEALTTAAEAKGVACWCGYGMTETASTVAARRANGGVGVGLPLTGHQIRLMAGEIRLKSAALGLGYWRNGEVLPLVDDEGWYATRDRGVWSESGLQVTGRTDNIFFSAGEGIQPELIERILLQHPAISQAFIVPLEDEEFGNRPVALLATEAPLSEIASWARSRLAGFQRPVRWYSLPDLSAGGIKISRARLANWVAEQEAFPPGVRKPADP